MELQPAPNAAGAADDRVTALARAKLAEFQHLKGIENPMTLEDAKASKPKIYKSLLREAAAELQPPAAAHRPLQETTQATASRRRKTPKKQPHPSRPAAAP